MAFHSNRFVIAAAAVTLAVAGDGIAPRGSSAAYPARANTAGATIGAALLSPGQVRKMFATDLNKAGYVVVEVAIYPEAGRQVKVAQADFMLRARNEGNAVRAASGETIAAVIADAGPMKDNTPAVNRHPVQVTQTAEIGYETGPRDPVTGRRMGGTYGGTGTAVSTGNDPQMQPPPPPSPPKPAPDQDSIERELSNKALPEGLNSEAVAGYLYFPRPSKKKSEPVTLAWYGADGTAAQLTLEPGK